MKSAYYSLSRLPKSRRWTSINDREQIPGLVAPFFPHYTPPSYNDAEIQKGIGQPLDSAHPAARLDRRHFPWARALAVGVNIYPMALLLKFGSPYPQIPFVTWREQVQYAKDAGFAAVRNGGAPGRVQLVRRVHERFEPYEDAAQIYPSRMGHISARLAKKKEPFLQLALKKAARRVPMAHSNATSKKRVGVFAYMRSRVAKRLRAALHLIVTRGAYVVAKPEEGGEAMGHGQTYPQIRFNEDDTGTKWSLQGWTYIFQPTSDIYRMPFAELIPQLREVLGKVNGAALKMERNWLANSLLQETRNTRQRPEPGTRSQQPVPVELPAANETATSQQLIGSNEEDIHRPKAPKRLKQSTSAISKATGHKAEEVWRRELTAGLAFLIPKGLLAKKK